MSVISVEALSQSKIASIGPITSKTAREHGLQVDAEPVAHTIPGLVEAMVQAVAPKTA